MELGSGVEFAPVLLTHFLHHLSSAVEGFHLHGFLFLTLNSPWLQSPSVPSLLVTAHRAGLLAMAAQRPTGVLVKPSTPTLRETETDRH